MAGQVPIKYVPDGSQGAGLGEFGDGDVVPVEHGGTGVTTLEALALLLRAVGFTVDVGVAGLVAHTHAPTVGGGSDGGRVQHAVLLGAGETTHEALDAFVASKGQAGGLATLNDDGLVVQDPARATAVPAATRIPVADENGRLNAWIDREDFFEIDLDGGLTPSETPTYSAMYELDGNGDIMPEGT